jgi:glycosyltransferase involved in cell wall biosynthesis
MKKEVLHLLDHPLVEFIGEIGEEEKGEFLGNAHALLFPIDWSEPFGLVMIESMACGTPVVAYRGGSVPEIIDDGVTGFIVGSIEESVHALDKIQSFDRKQCRQVFEERFSAARMVRDYLKIYERLLAKEHANRPLLRRKTIGSPVDARINGAAIRSGSSGSNEL